jgi:hypothetical protein
MEVQFIARFLRLIFSPACSYCCHHGDFDMHSMLGGMADPFSVGNSIGCMDFLHASLH